MLGKKVLPIETTIKPYNEEDYYKFHQHQELQKALQITNTNNTTINLENNTVTISLPRYFELISQEDTFSFIESNDIETAEKTLVDGRIKRFELNPSHCLNPLDCYMEMYFKYDEECRKARSCH